MQNTSGNLKERDDVEEMRRYELNEIKQEGRDWNQLTQVRKQWQLFSVG
jgi:hypothetical protein